MDGELAGLASAAAGELVKLLVTDAWERACSVVGGLWRRAHPDRASSVESALADSRGDLLAALESGDEEARGLLAAEWRARLLRLLLSNPELKDEVRRLAAGDLGVAGEEAGPARAVTMIARVSGGGSLYQAGRDQAIRVEAGQGDDRCSR